MKRKRIKGWGQWKIKVSDRMGGKSAKPATMATRRQHVSTCAPSETRVSAYQRIGLLLTLESSPLVSTFILLPADIISCLYVSDIGVSSRGGRGLWRTWPLLQWAEAFESDGWGARQFAFIAAQLACRSLNNVVTTNSHNPDVCSPHV